MPFTVLGLEKIQAARLKLLQDMQPAGALGKAVLYGTLEIQKGLVGRIHVDTGTYKAAQVTNVHGLIGRTYTAAYRNPKSGTAASVYGPYEEARGRAHAAYGNTFNQDGQSILNEAGKMVASELP
jgi:hypothetical protein